MINTIDKIFIAYNDCFSNSFYWTLLCFIFVDLVTGSLLALKNRKLNSTTSYYGVAKMMVFVIIPLLVYPIFYLNNVESLANGFITALISPYLISVIENLHLLGVKLPQALIDYFDANKFIK